MSVIKWAAAPTSRGNVLTTELGNGTGLADATFSAAGPTYDNTANLDRWGWIQFLAGGTYTPTAGAYISVYIVNSLDGTNFDDPASAATPGYHELVATIAVKVGTTITPRAITTAPFALPPGKFKFVLRNATGAALPASGNTLALYTANESVI